MTRTPRLSTRTFTNSGELAVEITRYQNPPKSLAEILLDENLSLEDIERIVRGEVFIWLFAYNIFCYTKLLIIRGRIYLVFAEDHDEHVLSIPYVLTSRWTTWKWGQIIIFYIFRPCLNPTTYALLNFTIHVIFSYSVTIFLTCFGRLFPIRYSVFYDWFCKFFCKKT